jgi:hypothetical protein
MKEYLAAAVALMIMSFGNFAYVIFLVSLYPEEAIVSRQSLLLLLVQCSGSLLCGVLSGYFLAIHTERRKVSSQSQLPQDCSVQE